MVVAVGGAVALGEWSEAASVVFLFALAQLLETRAMERARGAIRALMDLAPAEALVRRDGARRARAGRRRARRRRDRRQAWREDSARRPRRAPARATSTRRRSPASRCRSRRRRATRCSPAPSTAAARSTSTVTRLRPRLDARAHHPPRRARAGAARAEPDVRRSLRARLHAGRARRSRCSSRSCRRSSPAASWSHVDLPLARAAGDLLPVRAGDLDAGLDRVGARRRGAEGRADQGRRAPRAAGGGALRRVRQDRHADARPAARRRRGGRSTACAAPRSCGWPPRSSRAPNIRSAARSSSTPRRRAAGHRRRGRIPGAARAGRRGTGRTPSRVVVGNHRLFEERGLCSPALHAALESLTAEGCSTVMVARGGRPIGVIGVADEPRESAARRGRAAARAGRRARRAAHRRPRARRPGAGGERSGSTSTGRRCCPRTRWPRSRSCARATARWRWSATGSTTRRRSPPPTSASRWAWPAPTPRSRPPTSR